MTSVLLVSSTDLAASELSADLGHAGFHCLGAATWHNLVREALQRTPDLVVADEAAPGNEVFAALAALQSMHPLPVLLFTRSPDAERLDRALDAGVAAVVVDGYASARLRPLVHLARARFTREQALREKLAEAERRFEERKLVDRAKAMLMRARQIPEDEAFRMLRVASMHANLRVGQVSRQVIDAARFAEAINRAGQLRMLTQQAVKHVALQLLGDQPQQDRERVAELQRHGERNLDALTRNLSDATYGDLLAAVRTSWLQLQAALAAPARADALVALDGVAEQVLQHAERLTSQLEHAGLAAPLRVVNLSGRQRMLSQRIVKQALLARLIGNVDARRSAALLADSVAASTEFEQALDQLEALPLSSAEIRADLDQAREHWRTLRPALRGDVGAAAQRELRHTSESLLELFERLTRGYEHSLQMLLG